MNRFEVMPCLDQADLEFSQFNVEGYKGMLLPLVADSDRNCVLLFPVTKSIASTINYLKGIEDDSDDADLHNIEVYRTMIDVWKANDQYLSGILMDMNYEEEEEQNVFTVSLLISNTHDGSVDSVIKVSFIHAIIISVIEDMEIMVGKEMLSSLIPVEDFDVVAEDIGDILDEEQLDTLKYPYDHNIYQIVKQIMDGKIK
jgi:hypothetical protein